MRGTPVSRRASSRDRECGACVSFETSLFPSGARTAVFCLSTLGPRGWMTEGLERPSRVAMGANDGSDDDDVVSPPRLGRPQRRGRRLARPCHAHRQRTPARRARRVVPSAAGRRRSGRESLRLRREPAPRRPVGHAAARPADARRAGHPVREPARRREPAAARRQPRARRDLLRRTRSSARRASRS